MTAVRVLGWIDGFIRKNNENRMDTILFGMVTVLVLFGIIMVFSASYYVAMSREVFGNDIRHFSRQQAFAAGIGFVIMVIAAFIDYRKLKPLIPLGYILACGLLFYIWQFT